LEGFATDEILLLVVSEEKSNVADRFANAQIPFGCRATGTFGNEHCRIPDRTVDKTQHPMVMY
jgi:hypothetical protein